MARGKPPVGRLADSTSSPQAVLPFLRSGPVRRATIALVGAEGVATKKSVSIQAELERRRKIDHKQGEMMDPERMTLLTSIAVGIGLAAACGFRVFVPLLVTSIAANAGELTLASGFEWIGSTPAMVAFGVATAMEIAGYFIPWVDNLLDVISTPAAVVAGIVVSASVFADMEPFVKWALALVAGGGTAGAVQGTTVLIRGASTMATGGLGNPGVSAAEAGGSVATAGLAIMLPFIALFLVVVFVVVAAGAIFRRKHRFREREDFPE